MAKRAIKAPYRPRPRGVSKFGNIRVKHSGYSFASKGEAELFDLLSLAVKANGYRDLRVQHHVYLTLARICYIADFSAVDQVTGQMEWFEYKGFETPEWRLKRRLWGHYGPGPLHVYKGYGKSMRCTETIVPKCGQDF